MYRVPCTSKALHNIIPKFTVFCKSDGRTLFVGHWLFSYLVVWFRWKHKIDSHYLPADLDGGSQEFIFKPACVTVYPLRILAGVSSPAGLRFLFKISHLFSDFRLAIDNSQYLLISLF